MGLQDGFICFGGRACDQWADSLGCHSTQNTKYAISGEGRKEEVKQEYPDRNRVVPIDAGDDEVIGHAAEVDDGQA